MMILVTLILKGHTFEKPEKVPFRLTRNMIDGMGSTGLEGKGILALG
jgi:serine/threonine-protein kinase ATR